MGRGALEAARMQGEGSGTDRATDRDEGHARRPGRRHTARPALALPHGIEGGRGGGVMIFRQLFEPETSTYTYLVGDAATGEAVLIDPVDVDADKYVQLIRELGLKLVYALDTHVHADHVTALGTL